MKFVHCEVCNKPSPWCHDLPSSDLPEASIGESEPSLGFPAYRDIQEFWLVWFENLPSPGWAIVSGIAVLYGFPATGYAESEMLRLTGRGQCEWIIDSLGSDCVHYVADEEFWVG